MTDLWRNTAVVVWGVLLLVLLSSTQAEKSPKKTDSAAFQEHNDIRETVGTTIAPPETTNTDTTDVYTSTDGDDRLLTDGTTQLEVLELDRELLKADDDRRVVFVDDLPREGLLAEESSFRGDFRGGQRDRHRPAHQPFGPQHNDPWTDPFNSNFNTGFSNFNNRPGNHFQDFNRPPMPMNMTRVVHIEAECQDDFMRITVRFNGSFTGLIYSSGYAYDPECLYVNGTGREFYEFFIELNRCGTLGGNNHHQNSRKQPTKNFMWNTVTIQYNPLIEEEWDEHFKVTCEYGYDFWKTVTFPFLDVETATGNPVVFTLTPPECSMEIRYGYGTTGARINGPVTVGDPMTLIITMRSQYDGFDMAVNDCFAHNGANKRIPLIDHYGCPVDEKLINRFEGQWSNTDNYETILYAYMKAFRFTGSPALYIECDVRMCHGQCPAQPCHWRNSKAVVKREAPTENQNDTQLSETVNLFQALQVVQYGEPVPTSTPTSDFVEDPTAVCFKSGIFTAIASGAGVVLLVLLSSFLVMCLRMKRLRKSDSVDSIERFIPPKKILS